MKRIDLSLVLPCYNEAEIIADSVARIVEVLESSRLTYEIIFVDDKSQDHTTRLLRKITHTRKNYRALYHEYNMGRGKSVTDGILLAKGTVAGYIDIDLEVSPVYIPIMTGEIIRNRADMVIGKRIYKTTMNSIIREILSVSYLKIADRLLDTGGLDTESGYKFFRRVKILPVIKQTIHPHWFWDTESTVLARRGGLRIKEMNVLFVRRFDKTSSVRVVRDTLDYFKSLWKFRQRLKKIKS